MFNGLKTTGLKVVILIAFCLGIVQMSLLIRENNSLRSHLGRIIVLRQSMTELIEQAHRETADLSTRKGLLEKQLQIVSERLTSHENTIDGVANPLKNRIRDQESELERVRVYQLQMDECQAELTATHSLLVDSARDLAITRQGLQSLQEMCDPLLSLAKELDNY